MQNARFATFVTVLLLAGAFAGCIGSKDEPVEDNDTNTPTVDLKKDKPEGQQDGLGWIFGTVTDAVTNASLAGVNVSLAQGLGSAITDANGQYLILNIPRGEYILNARAAEDYLLSRWGISVFADEGTEMHFKLQPESGATNEEITPVVFQKLYFKETSGADYDSTVGAMSIEAPDGAPASNSAGHPTTGGYGATVSPSADILGGRDAARMIWEFEFPEETTLHADTENPVEMPDPSYPGQDVSLVRYNAMTVKMWTWKAAGTFLSSIKVEDIAPDGTSELLSLRADFGNGASDDPAAAPGNFQTGEPVALDYAMPFIKRGKEFHTFLPGHKLRVTFDDSNAHWVVYFFDGADYPAGIDLRKGPYLEPPKAGDRVIITVNGHTAAGSSNPYGIAWAVPVPPESDPVLGPAGIHRTHAGGYYVGTACPDHTAETCVGDSTVYFEVPKGAQTVYTRLEFSAPPVREPSAMMNDYDILLYEPSGKAHTHTAGYGGNQAELQFHDVFETPEWPQQWWVQIFAFLVVDSDWTCTIEIQF